MKKQLIALVHLCYARLEIESDADGAAKTGLSPSTIRRLARDEYTVAIRYSTLFKLADAAGLVLVMTNKKVATYLKDAARPTRSGVAALAKAG